MTTNTVTVEANQVARLDLKMPVGQLQETVQVDAVSAILQTETTTVGEVISGTTVQSLPLNGRNTAQLTLLLPGTMTYNPRGFTNIGAINSNRPFVNGNREQTNNFTVDGFDVNETIDNRVSYQPSPDALAEISVETNNYTADTGNVGGADRRERPEVGNERVSRQRLRVLQEQRFRREHLGEQSIGGGETGAQAAHAGATFGGPILRQRLFFFGDYQGSRHDAPGFGTASVAPAAWRSGDLSTLGDGGPRPEDRPAFSRESNSGCADQPGGECAAEQPGELPVAEPDRAGRHHRQLRGRDGAGDPGTSG